MKTNKLILLCIAFLVINLQAGSGVEVGSKAPDFKLQSLNKDMQVSLSSQKGNVVLVDFWASWCAPCKVSMPHLEKLSKKYGSFTIIAVNIDDDKENAIKFLKDLGLNINAVHDAAKKVVSEYDVPEMPTAYLIDQYGNVKYIYSGYSEEKIRKLEFAIRRLVNKK